MNVQLKNLILPLLAVLLELVPHAAQAATLAVPWRDLPDATDCSQAPVGVPEPCGTVRIVATGGSITFASTGAYTLSGNTADFHITPPTSNACVPGQTLAVGGYCLVGFVTFQPTSIGLKTFKIVSKTTDTLFQTSILFGSTGYTYAWQLGGWSTCSGGTGTWGYSGWSPVSGCGTVSQTRTASCVANALSSTQSRTIVCQRSDSASAADAYCTGARPASTQSCTPITGFSCGTQAATSQSVLLTDGCAYDWVSGPWSASSDTCSENATQTRTVSCGRSDGTTVADASCNATTRPPSSRSVSDFSGCTYTWQMSGWNACTGGTGTWSYSTWSPTSGCGTLEQTRTATCNADPDAGTQSRNVTCLRSDGTTVADGSCGGPKPLTSQSCTPESGFSCGVKDNTTQSVVLTDTCTYSWQTTAWSGWSSECSESATRTRQVRCLRADGVFVVDASCPPPEPETSESAGVFSGCTYSWLGGGFGACVGGSATWIAGQWLPESGCGPTVQSRSLTCTVDANSGTRTQGVHCERSDGNAVGESNCDAFTRPSSTESCTPGTADCGAAPPSSQSTVLTVACPSANGSAYRGCTPDPANGKYCVFTPL